MSDTIQQRMRRIRGKLSQREFAAKLGNDSDSGNRLVSAIETGRARPTDDYLKTVARICKESLDELVLLRDAGKYAPPDYQAGQPHLFALRDAPAEETLVKWMLDQFDEIQLREKLKIASDESRFDVVQVLAAQLEKIIASKEPE